MQTKIYILGLRIIDTMVLGLTSLFSTLQGLFQGFGFGTGYGSGVRFGYEDVYPLFKQNASELFNVLGINSYAKSGFKSSTGLNDVKY